MPRQCFNQDCIMCGVPMTVDDTCVEVDNPISKFTEGDKVWARIQANETDDIGTEVMATIQNTNHFENGSSKASIRLTVDETGEDFYTEHVDAEETLRLLPDGTKSTAMSEIQKGDTVIALVEDSEAEGGKKVTLATVTKTDHLENDLEGEMSVQIRGPDGVLYFTKHSDADQTLAVISPVQDTAGSAGADGDVAVNSKRGFETGKHVLAKVQNKSGNVEWAPAQITNTSHFEDESKMTPCIQLRVLNTGELVFTEHADADETIRYNISDSELMLKNDPGLKYLEDVDDVENGVLLQEEADGTCKVDSSENPTFYIEQSPQMFVVPAFVSVAQQMA